MSETPQPDAPAFTLDQIQAMIAQAIAENTAAIEERHATEMAALQDQVTAQQRQLAGVPTSSVPEHAGGIGTAIHDTWSQWEQELARQGKHPDQLAAANG